MKPNCLFCSIVTGDPTKLIWQNEVAVAFYSMPQRAPKHILVVPKEHFVNLDDLDNEALAGKLIMAVRAVAQQFDVVGRYRLTVNNGAAAGQTIEHLHFHILGQTGTSALSEAE